MKFTSTLLRKAWALAKQAAGEGSSRRFFGWALKEVRMEVKTKQIDFQPRHGRAYIARLTGLGGEHGLKREFLDAQRDYSSNRRHPWLSWQVKLVEGAAYEFALDGREFYVVEDGALVACERSFVERHLAG